MEVWVKTRSRTGTIVQETSTAYLVKIDGPPEWFPKIVCQPVPIQGELLPADQYLDSQQSLRDWELEGLPPNYLPPNSEGKRTNNLKYSCDSNRSTLPPNYLPPNNSSELPPNNLPPNSWEEIKEIRGQLYKYLRYDVPPSSMR